MVTSAEIVAGQRGRIELLSIGSDVEVDGFLWPLNLSPLDEAVVNASRDSWYLVSFCSQSYQYYVR